MDKLLHLAFTTKRQFGGLPWILEATHTLSSVAQSYSPKYYMTWQIQMVLEVSVVGTNVV